MIRKRLDKITQIPPERLTETPPPPRSLKIELTPRCNYRCKYCSINSREHKATDMPIDLFRRIVQLCRADQDVVEAVFVELRLVEAGIQDCLVHAIGEYD